ncbi:MAG: hypothetical protein HY843_05230 [Bdellovibrio sp.]|nr:hypothetical protein [Bdellovibrio sp.]
MVNSTTYHVLDRFIVGTKLRIQFADVSIRKAAKKLEKTILDYLHTRKQTKMMEILKEKELTEYKKQKSKYDQKKSEEIYVTKYNPEREKTWHIGS